MTPSLLFFAFETNVLIELYAQNDIRRVFMSNKYNDFVIEKITKMKKNGCSEKDVAKFFGYNVIDLRHMISTRHRANRIVLASMAKELKETGLSVEEIAEHMGKNASSIRLLLDNATVDDPLAIRRELVSNT